MSTKPPVSRQNSLFWRIVYWMGTIHLAVWLLAFLAVACGVATFIESGFSGKVAKHYIYQAPWFIGWLLLLCVNLVAVTLTRWPWQKRHIGFIVTHYGIVTLLIGAMIGQKFGYEGYVNLLKGEPPTGRLTLNEGVLLLDLPDLRERYTLPFEPDLLRVGDGRIKDIPIPESGARLRIENYSTQLQLQSRVVKDTSSEARPGVELHFVSAMVPKPMRVPLLLEPATAATFDFFGRGQIHLVKNLEPLSNDPSLKYRESQMVLAAAPGMNVSYNSKEELSGHQFSLVPDAQGTGLDVTLKSASGDEERWPLNAILHKSMNSTKSGIAFQVHQYWPDFIMKDGRPASVSKAPNNPAILVTFEGFTGPDAGERVLQLAVKEDGRISWRSLRYGLLDRQGEASAGEAFAPGWADWQATILAAEPGALLKTEVVEADESAAPQDTVPGMFARLVEKDGTSSAPIWIMSGRMHWLTAGKKTVGVGFGLRQKLLNFTLALKDFEVPRYEGSQDPSDFISTVEFQNMDGRKHETRIQMNQPSIFPPEYWRHFTGWNHKFSQAGWNPENLNETTLQVLHDPGWLLKWVGSLMISVGIFTLFYLKSLMEKKKTMNTTHSTTAAMPGISTAALLLLLLLAAPTSHAEELKSPSAESLQPLEQVVVQSGGRRKPLVAFAREMILGVYAKESYREGNTKLTPMQFVCSFWLSNTAANWQERPVIAVPFIPLKERLGLELSRQHFSASELREFPELQQLAVEAEKQKRMKPTDKLSPLLDAARQVVSRLVTFERLLDGSAIKVIPTGHGTAEWAPVSAAALVYPGDQGVNIFKCFENLRRAYEQGQDLSDAAAALKGALAAASSDTLTTSAIEMEGFYVNAHPFRWAWILYLTALVALSIAALLRKGTAWFWAGWGLALGGLLIQVFGFTLRVMISNRPPVANMYETILWVSFAVMAIALFFEGRKPNGRFIGPASAVSLVALILADLQPAVFDSSIQPLTAVLNNSFWLKIHVLTIVSSYAPFALALGMGHVILFREGIQKAAPDPAAYQRLYRVLQIGVLLLAVGTLLGGIWANVSWGRFWDWDPKETWALVSLLCYLVLLHGRIAGTWGGFGLAVGSVICFQSILMAWYGVNFILAKGLHSYGFGSGGLPWVIGFLVFEILFLGLILYPRLRSFLQKRKLSQV